MVVIFLIIVQKSNGRQDDDKFLETMQTKSYEIRKREEEDRDSIRQAIHYMKAEEASEIKK